MTDTYTDLVIRFGPQNRFTLYLPITDQERATAIKQLAQALMTSFAEANPPPKEQQKQMAFAWAQPSCGSFENTP